MKNNGIVYERRRGRSKCPLSEDRRRIKPIAKDSLSMYLKEIHKLSPLTREEEKALAYKIEKGDQSSLNELVKRNLKYVVSVANKYRGCGLSIIDLINEGNIGLIHAAKRFDPIKNTKFITYAVWWIRQAIMHALAEQGGTVRLPMKQAGILYKIGGKYKELLQRFVREPTAQDLSNELNISVKEIESVLRVYQKHLSLDAPIKDNEETNYIDLLEAIDTPPDERLLRSSLTKEVNELLKELSPREEKVMRLRFGFEGGEPKTLEKIGNEIGLSRERVRQIEKKAKENLKAKAKSRLLMDYLN
jgi:RNA polymerase primary sigma factor